MAAGGGELTPIVTGIVYCGVILACEEAHDLRRAREWTAVLTRWCEEQPEMVAFSGRCMVHRAEILQWQGAWGDALRCSARRPGGPPDNPPRDRPEEFPAALHPALA